MTDNTIEDKSFQNLYDDLHEIACKHKQEGMGGKTFFYLVITWGVLGALKIAPTEKEALECITAAVKDARHVYGYES